MSTTSVGVGTRGPVTVSEGEILNGERDRLFRSGERAFAAAGPDTRIEVVPAAAHLVNFDAPAAVTDALLRFARKLRS